MESVRVSKLAACLPNIQPRLPSTVALDFGRLLSQGFPHRESIFADSHLIDSAFQQAANILVHFKSLLEKMSRGDFAKYCDATKSEKGVSQVDSGSSHNLFKLLVATEKAGYIIIVKYNDTTEEAVALLKISQSSRIILQEIIPLNLVQIKDTLMLNSSEISEKDVLEAKAFVEQFIPGASEETLKVSDYRTAWIDQHIIEKPVEDQGRVVQIREIMAKAKA